MGNIPVIRWGFGSWPDTEAWTGTFTSREDAIWAGQKENDGDFYICSGMQPDPASLLPAVAWLLDDMANSAQEIGDVPEEWPNVSDEGVAELEELLRVWARKHAPCDFFVAKGEPELIVWSRADLGEP